jgi:flagellar motor switch protein FliG
MPSAYAEKKDKEKAVREDIGGLMAELSRRPQAAERTRKLTGPERAAVLMLSLGEQYGAKIFSLLDDDELREISIVMSSLGTIEAESVEQLLLEFVGRMSASGALLGNYDATERLLKQYLPPERVGGIMDEIRGPAGRNMWEKLANVQEEVLANYLKNEYPQTVAVVLSKLRPEHAARVLSILPEDLSLDCVSRMLKMEAVQKEVIERVEQTLRTEFMSNLSQTRRRDPHEVMAEIFNNFDRQTETRFLTALEEDNRDAAERIKALMFTFDDLIKLDPGSAQTLDAQHRQGQAGGGPQGRQRDRPAVLLYQHVQSRRQNAGGRHAGDGTDAAARRRRGAGTSCQRGQGSGRQGRNHHRQEPRRRRADLLRRWRMFGRSNHTPFIPAQAGIQTEFCTGSPRSRGRTESSRP